MSNGSVLYCPACGLSNPTEKVSIGGREVERCTTCKLVLEVSGTSPYQTLRKVLMADDADLLCSAVEDILLEKKLAMSVKTFSNGRDLIKDFVEEVKGGEKIDLVILDIQMPVMDGFTAARSLRAMERGLGLTKPTPIIFFSGKEYDENTKKVLEGIKKAIYLNKVTSSNFADIAQRVEKVLINLLTKG